MGVRVPGRVAFLGPGGGGDALAVPAHAVVRAEVLDEQRSIVLLQARVPPGDVALAQLDGVPILAPDGDLFAHERDDGLAPLVVLDDELQDVLRPTRLPAWGEW